MREDFFEIIHSAKKVGIEHIAITTNGLLLNDKKLVRSIKKNRNIITQLYIGVNGATSTTHDLIRGKGQFNKLIEILESPLVRKLPIGMDVCIGKWNVHEM